MDNIKDVVHQVIGKLAARKPDTEGKIERIWRQILDKKELSHTKLVGERQGKLSVHVDSPAWLYQMKTRKTKILERLREEIPDIQDIYFKIGKIQ